MTCHKSRVTCIWSRVCHDRDCNAAALQQLQELQFRKMSQTSFDIRTSLYIDTLQSQSLHDRSLEVNMDAVEDASVASL